jgi:hypothetical protein
MMKPVSLNFITSSMKSLTFIIDVPAEFSIKNWPTAHPAAKEALKEMVTTHCVKPLEAFDMHGRLINPTSYHHQLEGALVQMRFTVTHLSIVGKKPDCFMANIVSMRVLVPPQKIGPVTPRRKRVYRVDPFTPDISVNPTKKVKFF